MSQEEKAFWKQLLLKTFSMFGFTYFSVAVSLQQFTLLTPSLLSAGMYFFAELTKYYKITPNNKVLGNKRYTFLI